jgi:cell filamentation protein
MDSADFVDPYLDPQTGILRNLVGAPTREALNAAEGALTVARAMQLMDKPSAATNDLAELREIHRRLFGDVYAWAGQLRTVDIRKPDGEPFLPVSMIVRAADFAASELRADGLLRRMERARFIQRLAYHYDSFNYIHPFREGNGRTQRVFWNRVARDAGWQLDWQTVQGRTNDAACRAAAEERDFGPLRAMFESIAKPIPVGRTTHPGWPAQELGRLSMAASTEERRERSRHDVAARIDRRIDGDAATGGGADERRPPRTGPAR